MNKRIDRTSTDVYKVELENNSPAGTGFFTKRKRWAHQYCYGEWDWTVSETVARNPVFLFVDRNDALRFKLVWAGKQEMVAEE